MAIRKTVTVDMRSDRQMPVGDLSLPRLKLDISGDRLVFNSSAFEYWDFSHKEYKDAPFSVNLEEFKKALAILMD